MTSQFKHTRSSERGFTLVELSIVLVIIGLIVGGILVGQDLIEGARIRATVSQIERYNTSVNTFNDRYRAIPGDVRNNRRLELGLTSQGGATLIGDGNGILDTIASGLTGENADFWRHLSELNVVEGNYTGKYTGSDGGPDVGYPTTKLNTGGFGVGSKGNTNYFILGVNLTGAAATPYEATGMLTPTQAFGIDSKIDDGFGTVHRANALQFEEGFIVVVQGTNGDTAPTMAATGNCLLTYVAGEPGARYNQTDETPLCNLRVKMN